MLEENSHEGAVGSEEDESIWGISNMWGRPRNLPWILKCQEVSSWHLGKVVVTCSMFSMPVSLLRMPAYSSWLPRASSVLGTQQALDTWFLSEWVKVSELRITGACLHERQLGYSWNLIPRRCFGHLRLFTSRIMELLATFPTCSMLPSLPLMPTQPHLWAHFLDLNLSIMLYRPCCCHLLLLPWNDIRAVTLSQEQFPLQQAFGNIQTYVS